ncbi:MAG: hypothetical protein GX605_03850 [Chloroflexi bacterium]|nr:hypothetical protein [Chloroflexota bacterium]
MRRRWSVLALALLAAGVVGLYAFAVEPLAIRVETVRMPVPNLPPELEGLRVVQLSDLHIIALGRREAKAEALVNGLAPDLVVVTGDLIEPTTDPVQRSARLEAALAFLERLESPGGVWAIRGNTDQGRYPDQTNAYLERVAQSSVHLLVDRWERLEIGGHSLYLVGAEFASVPPGWFARFPWSTWEDGPAAAALRGLYNSYTHYSARAAMGWHDYTVRGIMKRPNASAGMGVTVYSQLPDGPDRYYRLRTYEEQPTFHIAPHGAAITSGTVDTGVVAEPGKEFAFALQVETRPEGTWVRAKAWPADGAEPQEWQAACLDDSDSRLTSGTVGLWAVGTGERWFSALKVEALDGTELWPAGRRAGEGWIEYGFGEGHVLRAAEGLPPDVPTLTLVHSPDQVREAEPLGLRAVLAGHTHGGQVRLPVVGAIYQQNSLGKGYVAGPLQVGDTMLYTNRGLGVRSGFPARFLAPPEITLVHLTSPDGH